MDLRGNPGGNLDTVCEILDLMLPEGLIVYTEDKDGNRQEFTSDEAQEVQVPLAVLVDGNSASASEIYAGAIQDYGIGQIVGTKTYGKGVVQTIYDLKDGTSLKLTVAEYFTPNGRNIDGEGITPDVEVTYQRMKMTRKQTISLTGQWKRYKMRWLRKRIKAREKGMSKEAFLFLAIC